MTTNEQILFGVVKKQQAVIQENQAILGVLISLLEKHGLTDYDELNHWITRLREEWPEKRIVETDPFEWLLNRKRPGEGAPDPDKPDWFQGIIDGGRDDEDPDQSNQ